MNDPFLCIERIGFARVGQVLCVILRRDVQGVGAQPSTYRKRQFVSGGPCVMLGRRG